MRDHVRSNADIAADIERDTDQRMQQLPPPVLSVWTICDSPTDMPHRRRFVCRRWTVDGSGDWPTDDVLDCDQLQPLRDLFGGFGFVCFARQPDHLPTIVEVWASPLLMADHASHL